MSDIIKSSPRTRSARMTRAILGLMLIYTGLIAAVLRMVYQVRVVGPFYVESLFIAMIAHAAWVVPAAALYFAFRRRVECAAYVPRMLSLVAVLLLAASLDLLVGIVYPPPSGKAGVCVPHPARGWTNRRNYTGRLHDAVMHFDGNGLRVENEEGRPADPGTRSILFVGDSVTLGYDIAARDAFGSQTAAILNDLGASPRWTALNAGTCGYDTRQEYHWFENEGVKLNPQLVVLQLCLNDVSWQFSSGRSDEVILTNDMDGVTPLTSWSGFGRAAIAWGKRLRFGDDLLDAATRIDRMSVEAVILHPEREEVRRAWQNVFAQIEHFIVICRERGIPLAMILFPVSYQIENPGMGDAPQRTLAKFASEKSIPLVDVLAIYRDRVGTGKAASKKLFIEFTHPTPFGHRLAAEGLVDTLGRTGLTPARRAVVTKTAPQTANSP